MLHLQTDTTPSHGNALQACVASLLGLEMEAVPNFVAAPEGYWDAMLAHAATLGLSLLKVPLTNGKLGFASNPSTRCLVRGDSPRGAHGHVVLAAVAPDGVSLQDVHDPHPAGGFLASPAAWAAFYVSNTPAAPLSAPAPAAPLVRLGELGSLVEDLGRRCPWTAAQQAGDMLYYTRRELLEVEEVLRKRQGDARLAEEVGDVLFDALLLAQVCTRDHAAVSVDACCASAIAKLRRRCPYMFGGEEAQTREEAEAQWQRAKRTEKAGGEAGGEAPPPTTERAAARAEARAAEAAASAASAVAVATAPTAPHAVPAAAVRAAVVAAVAAPAVVHSSLAATATHSAALERLLHGTTPEAEEYAQAADALPGLSDSRVKVLSVAAAHAATHSFEEAHPLARGCPVRPRGAPNATARMRNRGRRSGAWPKSAISPPFAIQE